MTFNLDGSDELTDEEFDPMLTHLTTGVLEVTHDVMSMTPKQRQIYLNELMRNAILKGIRL